MSSPKLSSMWTTTPRNMPNALAIITSWFISRRSSLKFSAAGMTLPTQVGYASSNSRVCITSRRKSFRSFWNFSRTNRQLLHFRFSAIQTFRKRSRSSLTWFTSPMKKRPPSRRAYTGSITWPLMVNTSWLTRPSYRRFRMSKSLKWSLCCSSTTIEHWCSWGSQLLGRGW